MLSAASMATQVPPAPPRPPMRDSSKLIL
jgi:hypothetical protein